MEYIKADEIKTLIEILEATLEKTKEFKRYREKINDNSHYMFELGKQRGLELSIRHLNKIIYE